MSAQPGIRGKAWFKALTGSDRTFDGDPGSLLTADAKLGEETARFLCVVPDPAARFPCAHKGEVGLEEALRARAPHPRSDCARHGRTKATHRRYRRRQEIRRMAAAKRRRRSFWQRPQPRRRTRRRACRGIRSLRSSSARPSREAF